MSAIDELKAAVGNGPYGYYPKVPLATAIAIVERLEFQRFALAQADKMGDDRIKELEQQVATLTAALEKAREALRLAQKYGDFDRGSDGAIIDTIDAALAALDELRDGK
jgi:hypothetical protein